MGLITITDSIRADVMQALAQEPYASGKPWSKDSICLLGTVNAYTGSPNQCQLLIKNNEVYSQAVHCNFQSRLPAEHFLMQNSSISNVPSCGQEDTQ